VSKIKALLVLFLAGMLGLAGIAWASGDWNAATSKVEDLKRRQMDLRKMSADEIRRLVKAVCEVDTDERYAVGKDAAERVASDVKSELSNLERVRDDAYKLIDEVLADPNLKDKEESAKNLKEDVKARWESILRMASNSMRGGNHPLVSYLSLRGMAEHKDYEHNSSNCDAYEVVTGRRKADCLRADGGEVCMVIELKPKNSRAISSGKIQAQEAAVDLTNEIKKMERGEGSTIMQELIHNHSDFAKCKRFDAKVNCYTLCPDINDDSEYSEGSARWETNCS